MKEDNTTIDPTWMERTGGFARDMTLRQWYAGLAMQGFVACPDVSWPHTAEMAVLSYKLADAMLKAGEAK
jgi:hypothetical protein